MGHACAERFFNSLKVEAIRYKSIKERELMRQSVFETIEVDYNRTRRHSANGFMSPIDFEIMKAA
ncbi:MAG: putative transposase [Alteromonadaceae bacterium]